MSTSATGLARVTGVDALDMDAAFLGLVVGKGKKLCKRPRVQFAFVPRVLVAFASPHFRRVADVGEVLEDNGRARWGVVHVPCGRGACKGTRRHVPISVVYSNNKCIFRRLLYV